MGKLDGQGMLPSAPLTQEQAAPGSQTTGQQPQQPGPGAPQASTEADAGAADAAAISTSQAPAPADPLAVVVYGPPLAGTSTQASLLGSRYGLPVVCVDGLLQEAYSLEQAEAAVAAVAAVAAAAAAPATTGTPGSPGRTQKRQLLELLTKLLFFSAPLGPSDFGSPPPARGQSAASGHASAHASGHAAPSTHGDAQHLLQSVPDVLTAALQLALQQEQYSKGYIIDGLGSKHMQSDGVVARCLLQAVGLVCKSLHPPEPSPPPASAGAAKGTKAPSRPPSSRPGVKAAPVPEVVLPIMTFSSPDVWEGPQQVGVQREDV
jgi:hypothetical protein